MRFALLFTYLVVSASCASPSATERLTRAFPEPSASFIPPPIEQLHLDPTDVVPPAKKGEVLAGIERALRDRCGFSKVERLHDEIVGRDVSAAYRCSVDPDQVTRIYVCLMNSPEEAAKLLRKADMLMAIRTFSVVPGLGDEAYSHKKALFARHKNVFISLSPAEAQDVTGIAQVIFDTIRELDGCRLPRVERFLNPCSLGPVTAEIGRKPQTRNARQTSGEWSDSLDPTRRPTP